MSDKSIGNLLRIAALPGASKIEFVRNRLVSALFNSAQATLISLDPDFDSYGHKVAELGGCVAASNCANLSCGAANLRYLCWAAIAEGSTETALSLIDRIEDSAIALPCGQSARRGILILDGCQWIAQTRVAQVSQRVREFVRNWIDSGGDLIAIGRHPADTAFLNGIPVVHMRSKYGEDWSSRDQAWLANSAWRESATGAHA